MSKKFLYNPVIGSYEVLNKSYNRLKSQGHFLLTNFREHLQDDDVKLLLQIREAHFESFRIEIFDLEFLVRIEINLLPEFNAFKKGIIILYLVEKSWSGEETIKPINLWFRFDEDGRIFFPTNDGIIPDYKEMATFVPDFLKILIDHITTSNYTTIPNSTYEGE